VLLPLPHNWQAVAAHYQLDQSGKPATNVVNIRPLRGGRRGRK
jgi:hypothetical protein